MAFKTGAYLKQQRERLGYTRHEAAARINISTAQLSAIEDGKPENLPGLIYAAGFVKSYARFLRLDTKEVTDYFRKEYIRWQEQNDDNVAEAPTRKTKHVVHSDNTKPSTAVLFISLAATFIFIVLWAFLNVDNTKNITAHIPPAPKVQTAASVIQIPQLSQPTKLADKSTLRTKIMSSRIAIVATKTAWVEITNPQNGETLFEDLLEAGKGVKIPDIWPISLSTGDIGALIFYVDGKKLLPIGASGDIVQNITLTPESLLESNDTDEQGSHNSTPVAAD